MKKIKIKQIQTPVELFSTMGCRTQNGADINAFNSYQMNIQSVIETGHLYDNYVSAAQKDGRGNICPVTIIMPTIAMEAIEEVNNKYKDDLTIPEEYYINTFMNLLDKSIFEAKDALLERFNYICSQPMESAKFMYENHTMAGYVPEEGIYSALKHGTLAVG